MKLTLDKRTKLREDEKSKDEMNIPVMEDAGENLRDEMLEV